MELLAHQLAAVEIARARPRFAFYDEPGCGKTIAMLAVCADRPLRTLVLAPKSVMRTAWLGDAGHFPSLQVRCLWHASAAKRRAMIGGAWDVGVAGFESFKADYEWFARAGIERLIIDESSKIKTFDSGISRHCHRFADGVRETYLLSGTPAPNNYTEYWSQLRALGSAATCGLTYWQFAYRYGSPVKRSVRAKGKTVQVIDRWDQSDGQRAALAEHLARWCRFTKLEDVADMPGQTSRVIDVDLSTEEADAYARMSASLEIRMKSGERLTVHSCAELTKCRQITGGTVLADGVPVNVGASKLAALADLLDEIGGRSAVIWAEYSHEVRAIRAMIAARGETVEVIDGSTSGDAERIVAAFQRGDVARVVCQPQACAHGITLTHAHYSVFYSLGFSAELHEQAKRRIYRFGQRTRCHHYYLVAPGTVDVAAYRVCMGKKSAADAIREAVMSAESEAAA